MTLADARAPRQCQADSDSGEISFETVDKGVEAGQVVGADRLDPLRKLLALEPGEQLPEHADVPGGGIQFGAAGEDDYELQALALRQGGARCPGCGSFSGRLHGSYLRFPADLPVAGRRAVLRLRVRRLAPAPAESGTPWPTGHRFADRTRAKHATVHALLTTGHSRRSIQRQLNMTYRTVQQLADAATPEDLFQGLWRNRRTKLGDFKPCLHERWAEGRTNAWILWEEIKTHGYCAGCGGLSFDCALCLPRQSIVYRPRLGQASDGTPDARRPACSRPARVDHRSAPVHHRLIRRPRGCRAPGFACRVSRRTPYTK
ncbi:transposase family protein [Streptomyces nigra]|uniref:transposase family protein n=1 Tax=Streptomyces nigra TaxID=1827580 RepID=UPI0036313B6A